MKDDDYVLTCSMCDYTNPKMEEGEWCPKCGQDETKDGTSEQGGTMTFMHKDDLREV